MSPRSAYPKGYKLGPDNRSWLMRLKNKVQVWFTGGPRVPSGFWKFREYPIALLKWRGKGFWRYENTNGSMVYDEYHHSSISKYLYLSRIQCWAKWHFALMWPLAIHWHIFWRQKDVVKPMKYRSIFGITKLFAGYLGWVRDSDKIYKPKFYAGGNFE